MPPPAFSPNPRKTGLGVKEPCNSDLSCPPISQPAISGFSHLHLELGNFSIPSLPNHKSPLMGLYLSMSTLMKRAQCTPPQLLQEAVHGPVQVMFAFAGVSSSARETAEQLQADGGLAHNALALSTRGGCWCTELQVSTKVMKSTPPGMEPRTHI